MSNSNDTILDEQRDDREPGTASCPWNIVPPPTPPHFGWNSLTAEHSLIWTASGSTTADDYPADTTTSGTVSVGGSIIGELETSYDQDWFKVSLTAGRLYAFDLKGAASGGGTLSDTDLRLLDPSVSYVSYDWDSGIGPDARLVYSPVVDGTFYLDVSGGGNSVGGTYTLVASDIGADDHLGSSATTSPLALGGTTSGNIQFYNDADWFRIALTAGQVYAFEMQGGDTGSGIPLGTYLQLLDSGSYPLASSTGYGLSSNARISFSPDSSGTYFLSAKSINNANGIFTGTYTITAADLGADDYGDDIATAGTLAVGATATGSIQFSNDQDWLRVNLTAGRIYAFDLMGVASGGGTLADPGLSLMDGAGYYLAFDADSGAGTDARLIYSPLGNATLYLAAFGSGSTGSYTLVATDIGADDYPGSSATTGTLNVGGTVSGNIQYSGDVDWVAITLTAGRNYVFDMKGVDAGVGTLSNPSLYLLDGAGNYLTSGSSGVVTYASVSYSPPANGTYFLSAQGASTGTYTLTAADIGGDDYAGGIDTTGTLVVGGAALGAHEIPNDRDWFRIELTAGEIYAFDLKGAASGGGTLSDPRLALLDGATTSIADTGYNGVGSDARLIYSPSRNGTFYLSAEGINNATGTYTLVATDLGADDYPSGSATNASLAIGGTVTGNIQFNGDQDCLRITLTAGRVYTFDMKGVDSGGGTLSAPFLFLMDSAEGFVASDFEGGTGTDAHIGLSPVSSGTYYLSARSIYNATGTYTLTASDLGVDDYFGGIATTGTLAVGATINGNIQFTSDQDWLRIELAAGHFYIFDMKGVDSGSGSLQNPYLQLLDSAGGFITYDSDSGTGIDARLGLNVINGGTYYIVGSGSGSTGTYTLSATDVGPDDYAGDISTAGVLVPGNSITGNIQIANEEDWFRVELSAGRIYRFDLRGKDSGGGTLDDPALQIRNAVGNSLPHNNNLPFNYDFDYDSGTGRDARLTFLPLTSGTYYVSAKSQNYSDFAIGSYTLSASDLGADDYVAGTTTTSTLEPGASATGNIQFVGDQDWLTIDLTAGRTYIFGLQGTASGQGTLAIPSLRIHDNAGYLLASDYKPYGASNDALLAYTPTQSGRYFLSAASGDNGTGTYTLTAGLDDYPSSALTAGNVTVGGSSHGDIQYYGDVDWFKVNLNADTEYYFDLKGVDSGAGTLASGNLALLDESGNGVSGNGSHLFYKSATSGTYYLAAMGMNTIGTYSVSAGTDDFNGSISTTGTLTPGASVTGTIQGSADQDWLKITLTAGTSYEFLLEARDSGGGTLNDPLLILRDSSGAGIINNLDGGLGRDARLTYIPTASGSYYLSVESQDHNGNDPGTYTLSARNLGSGYQATPVSNAIALTGTATLDGLIQGSAWQFSGARVLTYSFNAVIEDGFVAGGPWSDAAKDAIREALLTWEAVANISFVEVPGSTNISDNSANIAFGHTGSYLYPAAGLGVFPSPVYVDQLLAEIGSNRTEYPRFEGDVVLDDYASEMQYLNPGDSGFWVGMHELGHALGLKHPFDDGANGRPTFLELGISDKDIRVQTTMSYDNPASSLTDGYTATPMLLDILAIQRLYGANTSYHNTDNTYYLTGDGSVRTLWDTGGNDWLDASGLGTDIVLNLEAGSINPYGFQGSVVAIAYGVSIENARGGTGADTLTGTSAANILDGGPGVDTLKGGPGDDTYIVDNRGDRVVEFDSQGNDTVRATLSWTLGPHLENLELTGAYRSSGTGNALDNTLTGNAAGNILDGGGGADTLIGGAGNDTYVVDNPGDVIQETGSDVSDSVRAWVDWTLGDNLENLILLGTKPLNGTGNALNNALTGNGNANVLNGGGGNDVLNGGSGNDTLTGGAGSDTFAFTTPLNALRNVDSITDFTSGTDRIQLSPAIFRDMGFSGSPGSDAFFHLGATAQDADDRILYDQAVGSLYYDADGAGALAAVQFATLSGSPQLYFTDFQVG